MVGNVNAIKYVDQAVPQLTMDKMDAWRELKFDVLFHESDWKGSDMYNNIVAEFEKAGVDVVFLPHTSGVSSTMLTDILHHLNKNGEY